MWTMDISTTVFSRLKAKGTADLKKTYKDLNFTQDDRAPVTPKFPTVYYKEMSSPEQGQTLDGATVNGILYSCQLEVTDNSDNPLVTKEVMNKMVDYMKEMRFQIVGSPEYQNTNNVYRMVARFRRMIGAQDVI